MIYGFYGVKNTAIQTFPSSAVAVVQLQKCLCLLCIARAHPQFFESPDHNVVLWRHHTQKAQTPVLQFLIVVVNAIAEQHRNHGVDNQNIDCSSPKSLLFLLRELLKLEMCVPIFIDFNIKEISHRVQVIDGLQLRK